MKQALLVVLCGLLLCGCKSSPSSQSFWGAMAAGMAGAGQQMNQQSLIQQQQWNQQFMEAQRERLAAQRAAQEQQRNAGSAAYNPYTGTSQYIPPGWHKVWDSSTSTWIIQPY